MWSTPRRRRLRAADRLALPVPGVDRVRPRRPRRRARRASGACACRCGCWAPAPLLALDRLRAGCRDRRRRDGRGSGRSGVRSGPHAPHSSGLLEVIGSGGFALAVIGACLLLCRTVLTWVVLPLRAVGAMPLTAYTAQLLVWAVDRRRRCSATPATSAASATSSRSGRSRSGRSSAAPRGRSSSGAGPLEWAVDRISRLAVPRLDAVRRHGACETRVGRVEP